MKNKVLHVMIAEEVFSLPVVDFILNDLKLDNHRFLILNTNKISHIKHENVTFLSHPLRKRFLFNLLKFCKDVSISDKIVAHAAPLPFFFFLLPWKHKNVIWSIHGGIDIPVSNRSKTFLDFIDKKFKKRIGFHTTHIKEDSNHINKVLSSKAKFLYSPMYLSNVINGLKNEDEFLFKGGLKNKSILVGNSASPSNNHKEAFEKILNIQLMPKKVISVLSYGLNEEYKKNILEIGSKYFGKHFLPVNNFMKLEEYLKLLDNIDFVLFNHARQEAMGATIQLLSLAKPIFFNQESPAFKSFVRRGYKVFSIDQLADLSDIEYIDLRINRHLLLKDYSIEVLSSFYSNL